MENATGKTPGSWKTSQWHPSSLREGYRTGWQAVVINLAPTGAESREERAAHADTPSPAHPGLQRERRMQSLGGGSCILRRKTVLPPRRGRPQRAGERRNPRERTRGEGRWGSNSRAVLGPLRYGVPRPSQPHVFQVKVYLGGCGGEKERERKGRGYSHGLQRFAEPGFQRLEVFYDHFNHHPERPGPPASLAAAAAPTAPAGSAAPRRPGPPLPTRLPSRAEAASRFGKSRLAGAGGPSATKGAEPAERRLLPAGPALAAPRPVECGPVAPQFSPLPPASGGEQRGRRAQSAAPKHAAQPARPASLLSRRARRSERASR